MDLSYRRTTHWLVHVVEADPGEGLAHPPLDVVDEELPDTDHLGIMFVATFLNIIIFLRIFLIGVFRWSPSNGTLTLFSSHTHRVVP